MKIFKIWTILLASSIIIIGTLRVMGVEFHIAFALITFTVNGIVAFFCDTSRKKMLDCVKKYAPENYYKAKNELMVNYRWKLSDKIVTSNEMRFELEKCYGVQYWMMANMVMIMFLVVLMVI